MTHSSVAFEIDIVQTGDLGECVCVCVCVCVFWSYLKGCSKYVILSEQTQ